MKVELEIVTDGRLPTEADGNERGNVFKCVGTSWYATHWAHIRPGDIWLQLPPPPPPPEPPIDTSLAASISRFTGWLENAIFDEPLGSDCIAVRDAARKWDEAEKLKKSPCYDESTGTYYSDVSKKGGPYDHLSKKFRKDLNTQASEVFGGTDPDGVGEGWRLLREGETICNGDQYESQGQWRDTHDAGTVCKQIACRRRRRIEAKQ